MKTQLRHITAFSLSIAALVLAAFFLAPAFAAHALAAHAQLSAYTVNTVSDHAPDACDAADCTLREAILAANAHANGASPDEIHFNIPTGCDVVTGVCTITLTASPPNITDPVVIDGYTQPGASANTLAVGSDARLLIALTAFGQSSSISGLRSTAGSSTIRGLAFSNLYSYAISAEGSSAGGIIVEGNHITYTGWGAGVKINNAPAARIGGTQPAMRNVISRNSWGGITITGSGAAGSFVQGNYIGTDPSGLIAMGNGSGGENSYSALLIDGAANALIGGIESGAGNLISGNRFDGIRITGSSATGVMIQGNYIGVDATGTAVISNESDGIQIDNAPGVVIGGVAAGARNLISGNQENGISISGNEAAGCIVQGNYIGTDVTGMISLGNGHYWSGILIKNTPNTLIGGLEPGARNLISGNLGYGIEIAESGAVGNVVQGNYIGTNVTGTAGIGNGSSGVVIAYGSSSNIIGGTGPGARNVISGNWGSGIDILGGGQNAIQGNYIGVDMAGATSLGNNFTGIVIFSSTNNVIGGKIHGAGNIISGNEWDGIENSYSSGNSFQGNYIGTNASGTAAIGNSQGFYIIGSPGISIGGVEPGAGNLISGNRGAGIYISAAEIEEDEAWGTIQGNFIGTDMTGTNKLGNKEQGIFLNNAPNHIVGGTVAGARNLISGNGECGITIASNSTTLEGNFIGTDITGTTSLGNGIFGVEVEGVGNIVGGTSPAARNLISGNDGYGIYIVGRDNTVQGNFIGTDVTGKTGLSNKGYGLLISGASNNTIGGTISGARNLISGNMYYGIKIQNNGYPPNNLIGNIIQGNYIGTDITGIANLGNLSGGILLYSTMNNLIGGTTASAGNLIISNGGNGVSINSMSEGGYGNRVQGNSIFGNTNLGIDLGNDGITLNDVGDGDIGPNHKQNFPLLTYFDGILHGTLNSNANSAFRVEFFAINTCDPSGYGEGEQFLGALDDVVTDGNGSAAFTFPFSPASSKLYLTATATNITTGDTSEFSPCFPVDARSFIFLSMIAR